MAMTQCTYVCRRGQDNLLMRKLRMKEKSNGKRFQWPSFCPNLKESLKSIIFVLHF